MKTIINSILAGSLLATFAFPQSALSSAAQVPGRRTFPHRTAGPAGHASAKSSPSLLVYVLTGGLQFGVVDANSGAFLPIGPGLPPDVGGGLVPGPGKSLLSLSFSGNLVAIDPATGSTAVVGPTGLGDCSSPTSACGLNSASGLGYFDGQLYAVDFANNLYSVDAGTGAATLIGPTGIPALTFVPFSGNPDGTLNVFAESLFSRHGKFYANFGTAALDPQTGTVTSIISGEIYEIDRKTGRATPVALTDTNLTSVVNVNDTLYAFNAHTGQVVILDVMTGQITPVSDLDPAASLVGGATPARPVSPRP